MMMLVRWTMMFRVFFRSERLSFTTNRRAVKELVDSSAIASAACFFSKKNEVEIKCSHEQDATDRFSHCQSAQRHHKRKMPPKKQQTQPQVAARSADAALPASTTDAEPLKLFADANATAAHCIFFGDAVDAARAPHRTASPAAKSAKKLATLADLIGRVESLPLIDEAITSGDGADNSFVLAVAGLVGSEADTSIVPLLCRFLKRTSALAAHTFVLALATAVSSCAGSSNADSATTTAATKAAGRNAAAVAAQASASPPSAQTLRAVAAIASATAGRDTAASVSERAALRGSATSAARKVFAAPAATSSSTDGPGAQQRTVAASPPSARLVFEACLAVLAAAADAGRQAEVVLLATALDGIACAHSQRLPAEALRDAAELLTALGVLATVDAPRLRGIVSAWNAPRLPATKEAMVVVGGPFRIDVAPEIEVRHVTVAI